MNGVIESGCSRLAADADSGLGCSVASRLEAFGVDGSQGGATRRFRWDGQERRWSGTLAAGSSIALRATGIAGR